MDNELDNAQLNVRIAELEKQVAELLQFKLRCAQMDVQLVMDRYGVNLEPSVKVEMGFKFRDTTTPV